MVYESREEDVEAYVGYDFRLTPVQDMQWMIDPSDQAAITIFLTLCTPCKCNVPYGPSVPKFPTLETRYMQTCKVAEAGL